MAERIRQDPFTPSDSLHRALLVIRIKSGPTIASGQNGLINCSPLCARVSGACVHDAFHSACMSRKCDCQLLPWHLEV